VEISEVEGIDVPVYDGKAMGPQVRQESIDAVSALLSGDMETAENKLRGMYKLVKSGVRLTAEGVEDLYLQNPIQESDWFLALREQADQIRSFLGTDALRVEARKPQFSTLLDGSVTEQQAEPQRRAVAEALGQVAANLSTMRTRISLAKQVTESHRPRDTDADVGMVTAVDFVEFVSGFSEDLDATIGLLNDAGAVAEDGCIKCLARIHDGISGQMYEWGLATAFCEKLARRFVLA
jgi:hypothetical protein